ncbi:MAG: sugar dehydrogenase [Ardenticatenia bacterium]|nr:MAG: sugar dehydrogenase [Ardenticatenia bacterium]
MDKVGFGVIGTGIFGENHALVYSRLPEAELVAVCDLDAKRARAVAEKYGARTWYTDYEQLLKHPDIQAVSIATPDFAHRDIAVAAAQAGKHILCEKPLATNVQDAQDILEATRRAGVKLMVDYHNRVSPPFVAAKQSVDAGEIGTPAYGYIRLSNTTWVPMEMLTWGSKSSALWFLGSHTIDIMHYLLQDRVRRVYAVDRAGILRGMGVNTKDFHVAIAEFEKGTVVTFENAWILPRSHPMVYEFRMQLLGSQGALYVNTSHHGAIEKHIGGTISYADVLGATPTSRHRIGGFALEAIARFVDAVVYNEPVLATGEEGLAAVRVAAAIEESAATGRPVDL